MKLSTVVQGLQGKLISDGDFETLNYCTAISQKRFLTFMENPKYAEQFAQNGEISCVLCTQDMIEAIPDTICGVFVVDEPKVAFHRIHNKLADDIEYCLTSFETQVGQNCHISVRASIDAHNVKIGNNVIVEEFASIKEHSIIGDNCIVHAGTVIGGKSFTFVRCKDDGVIGLRDLGRVIIEDDVEICSCCHIARGTLPSDVTSLGSYTKLDAMVHIGHGTKIGKRVFIPSGAHIAGNVIIGDDSWIGVNATISNRITIGSNARVSLGSVVTKSVGNGETVTGNFAIEHSKFLKNLKKSLADTE